MKGSDTGTISGFGKGWILAKVYRSVARHGISQRTKALRAASLIPANPAIIKAVEPIAAQAH